MTDTGATYSTLDVPIAAGQLRVARWGNGPRTVVAVHGLTGSHAEFHALADQLGNDVTLIAPDLRGRCGSSAAGPPYGIGTHADDVIAVLDHLGITKATLLGHSMGGFVSVVAAHRHPARVERVVLVDGGLPARKGWLKSPALVRAIRTAFRVMPASTRQRATANLLRRLTGSSIDRLDTTYTSVDDYLAFWRGHPALADHWNPYVEKAFAYELQGEAPNLRSGIVKTAILSDSEGTLIHDDVERAVPAVACPAVVVRATEGFRDGESPIYSDVDIAHWKTVLPQLRDVVATGTNHYTILLTEQGAKTVAEVVREELAIGTP